MRFSRLCFSKGAFLGTRTRRAFDERLTRFAPAGVHTLCVRHTHARQGRDGPAPSVALVGDPGSGKTFAAHTAAALLPSGMVKWANHVTDMNAPANGLVTVMDEAPCGWNEVSDAAPEHVNCFVTKDPTNVLSSEQLAHSIFVRMRRGTSLAEVERIGNSDLPGGPVPGFADDVRHLFFRRRQLDVAQYLGLVEQPALDADVVDALQRWQDAHGPLADYARVKAKAVHAARCMKNFLTVVLEFGHCANARAGRFTMAHLQRCGRTQPMEDELCDILVAACVF